MIPLGNDDVIKTLIQRIEALEANQQTQEQRLQERDERIHNLTRDLFITQTENRSLRSEGFRNPSWSLKSTHYEGAGKIALKVTKVISSELGGKLLLKDAGKFLLSTQVAKAILTSKPVEKVLGKSAGELIGKEVPVLGLVLGVGFGIQRFCNGEILKGFGEITSGAFSCVPGVGTGVSLALDAAMLGDDIRLTYNEHQIIKEKHTADSYEILELDINATREELDRRARDLQQLYHPDRLDDFKGFSLEQIQKMSQAVSAAKEWIYQQKGWN